MGSEDEAFGKKARRSDVNDSNRGKGESPKTSKDTKSLKKIREGSSSSKTNG